MKVLIVEKNGIINEIEYVESVDRISKERVREIIIEALTLKNKRVKVERINSDERDIYTVQYTNESNRNDLVICAREMTPGGRSFLKNEQRIQPQAQQINYIYSINETGGNGILIGVYERGGEVVLVAWKSSKSTATSPTTGISKQIKIETIAKAMALGFAQQSKGRGEFVCAFRKEYIDFYIENSKWIHDKML